VGAGFPASLHYASSEGRLESLPDTVSSRHVFFLRKASVHGSGSGLYAVTNAAGELDAGRALGEHEAE